MNEPQRVTFLVDASQFSMDFARVDKEDLMTQLSPKIRTILGGVCRNIESQLTHLGARTRDREPSHVNVQIVLFDALSRGNRNKDYIVHFQTKRSKCRLQKYVNEAHGLVTHILLESLSNLTLKVGTGSNEFARNLVYILSPLPQNELEASVLLRTRRGDLRAKKQLAGCLSNFTAMFKRQRDQNDITLTWINTSGSPYNKYMTVFESKWTSECGSVITSDIMEILLRTSFLSHAADTFISGRSKCITSILEGNCTNMDFFVNCQLVQKMKVSPMFKSSSACTVRQVQLKGFVDQRNVNADRLNSSRCLYCEVDGSNAATFVNLLGGMLAQKVYAVVDVCFHSSTIKGVFIAHTLSCGFLYMYSSKRLPSAESNGAYESLFPAHQSLIKPSSTSNKSELLRLIGVQNLSDDVSSPASYQLFLRGEEPYVPQSFEPCDVWAKTLLNRNCQNPAFRKREQWQIPSCVSFLVPSVQHADSFEVGTYDDFDDSFDDLLVMGFTRGQSKSAKTPFQSAYPVHNATDAFRVLKARYTEALETSRTNDANYFIFKELLYFGRSECNSSTTMLPLKMRQFCKIVLMKPVVKLKQYWFNACQSKSKGVSKSLFQLKRRQICEYKIQVLLRLVVSCTDGVSDPISNKVIAEAIHLMRELAFAMDIKNKILNTQSAGSASRHIDGEFHAFLFDISRRFSHVIPKTIEKMCSQLEIVLDK